MRKKIAEDEAKSFVDLENMKSELSTQKAEADLLNTENKLAALDAYYLAQQEKYIGNEDALAELELFYNEQKLQLEQQYIQQIEAMKDEQYLQQKNRETKALNDFVKNMDFRKQMSKSQAEDFSKWESFMANASSSESKEIAAIGKTLSIYNIGVKTAEAAMGAYNAMAAIPIVGPGLGIAAAAAAIAFGAEQVRNVEKQQVALAAGGTFTATQPTTGRIGNQDILFGEAGDEAVTFTPLSDNDSSESSGPRPCYIVIEGYARDTLIEALYYSTAEWKRRGGIN